jgi:periplasmic protein TonB
MKNATAESSPSATFTEFNVLQDQGKPHFIRLHDVVVKQLERQLAANPDSTGLLLGSIEENDNCTIAVEEFEPAAEVEERVRAWKPRTGGKQRVVGYYRSHSRAGFTLDPSDHTLFERCFPKESRLALLVKPPKEEAGTAMFFLGENGQLAAERATVEFPFNLRELGAEEPGGGADSPAKPTSADASPAAPPKPARGGLTWKIGLAGVVVIASVFGVSELHVFDRTEAPRQAVVDSPAAAQEPVTSTTAPQPEAVESEPAAPRQPEPSEAAKTAVTKPASPGAFKKPTPESVAPRAQQTLVAENLAPNSPVPVQPIAQTPPPAPMPEAQPPVTRTPPGPPANTGRPSTPTAVAPPTPIQTSKPVEPSLPYTPPQPIRQYAPVAPENVRRSITGEVIVQVKVNVDSSGKVIGAEPLGSGDPVAQALAGAAISAVKRWQFEPARRGAEKVTADTVLTFRFRK